MYYLPKSSLELTFTLIRPVQPSLALKIRNATILPGPTNTKAQIPLAISESDVFIIVNELMAIENQARMGAKADKGRQILASALIADWLTLDLHD